MAIVRLILNMKFIIISLDLTNLGVYLAIFRLKNVFTYDRLG